ncbi:MAG: hypothetical protein AABX38_04715 [Candidatus Micrarchaeota archaeon]
MFKNVGRQTRNAIGTLAVAATLVNGCEPAKRNSKQSPTISEPIRVSKVDPAIELLKTIKTYQELDVKLPELQKMIANIIMHDGAKGLMDFYKRSFGSLRAMIYKLPSMGKGVQYQLDTALSCHLDSNNLSKDEVYTIVIFALPYMADKPMYIPTLNKDPDNPTEYQMYINFYTAFLDRVKARGQEGLYNVVLEGLVKRNDIWEPVPENSITGNNMYPLFEKIVQAYRKSN